MVELPSTSTNKVDVPGGGQWCDPHAVLEDGMGAVTAAKLAAIIIKDHVELKKKLNKQLEEGRKAVEAQAAVVRDETPGFGALSIAAMLTVMLQDEVKLAKMLKKDKAAMKRVSTLFDESQAKLLATTATSSSSSTQHGSASSDDDDFGGFGNDF